MIVLRKSQKFILLLEWLPVGDDLVTAMPLTILTRIFKFQRPLWMIRSRNFASFLQMKDATTTVEGTSNHMV